MKNTRFRLPLLIASLLAITTSPMYASERTDALPSFAEDLASDLYLRQTQPSARSFGQCLGGYKPAPVDSTEEVPASGASGNRVISAAMDRLIGERSGTIQFQGDVVIQDGGRRLLAPTALVDRSMLPAASALGCSDFLATAAIKNVMTNPTTFHQSQETVGR